MSPTETIFSFLVAVLLGFLIGLERERKREISGSIFAGIRTFPLIALFGAIIGRLSEETSFWLIAAALLGFGGLLLLSYWRASSGEKVGGTTEVTALVAFGLGVLAGLGDFASALAGAVIATGILSLKDELRLLSGAISRADLFALVQFAAVSLVVLPIVPNEHIGPWEVWNPRNIWLLVVLISGISFVGYILSKIISTARSIGLSGLIGGIASSTAVSLSFAGRSKESPAFSQMFAAGILAATAVSTLRLLILIAFAQPRLVIPSLGIFFVYGSVAALGGWLLFRNAQKKTVEGTRFSNPFELRTALTFAALFALILLVTQAAQELLGTRGVLLASGLAGLTQLDAITLTLAQQLRQGLELETAVKALAIALASNTLFKLGLAFSLGSRQLAKALSVSLLLAAALAVAVAWLL